MIDDAVAGLLLGLLLNVVSMTVLMMIAHRLLAKRPEIMFMLGIINVVVFGIAYTMLHVSLGVGAAFGLFALFGILRFRTGTLGVAEMSLLFAALSLAVVNSSGPSGLTLTELFVINASIVMALAVGFQILFSRNSGTELHITKVTYDRLDLLANGKAEALRRDLTKRTGLDIVTFDIQGIDLSTSTAVLRISHPVDVAGASNENAPVADHETGPEARPNGETRTVVDLRARSDLNGSRGKSFPRNNGS
ncbi:MAG: DUF4956 domain-containing protein [Acidimicrobiia bacterium]|nr:DUF4956 domain-containing protein [Acidimicrobiia bacterium]NNL48575.1 DUF4956 domain-containing protein [Acidimicrobiia bacterium]